MAAYPTDQRFVLHSDRLVPLAAAQVVGVFNRLRKACSTGLASYVPTRSLAIPAPIHRESKKIKTARTLSTFLIDRWSPEVYQPCLFRVKTQVVPPKSPTNHIHHPLCVIHAFKADNEVITVSNKCRASFKTFREVPLEQAKIRQYFSKPSLNILQVLKPCEFDINPRISGIAVLLHH
jgi:hypothetical protein